VGEHAPYAAGADAPVELSGGRGQLDAAIRSASEDRWVRTGPRGCSCWSPRGSLESKGRAGKVCEVWAFKRPRTRGRGGARARVEGLLPTATAAFACAMVVGDQGGRVVGLGEGIKATGAAPQLSIHALPPPGAGAPLDLSGERERLATAVDPASEGRWVRKSVRGSIESCQRGPLEARCRAGNGLRRKAFKRLATGEVERRAKGGRASFPISQAIYRCAKGGRSQGERWVRAVWGGGVQIGGVSARHLPPRPCTTTPQVLDTRRSPTGSGTPQDLRQAGIRCGLSG